MQFKRITSALVVASTLAVMSVASSTPASAWCRWGGCGWGPGPGPFFLGALAGAIVGGTVAAAAAGPGPYYPGPYVGHLVCPPGYHLGPMRRACWPNR